MPRPNNPVPAARAKSWDRNPAAPAAIQPAFVDIMSEWQSRPLNARVDVRTKNSYMSRTLFRLAFSGVVFVAGIWGFLGLLQDFGKDSSLSKSMARQSSWLTVTPAALVAGSLPTSTAISIQPPGVVLVPTSTARPVGPIQFYKTPFPRRGGGGDR
jgi:hypothetical protein